LTAGLRVNEDGRQLTSKNARRDAGVEICTLDPALRDSPDVCRATLPERSFRDVPFTIGLDFRANPQSLFYAKLSRGYRAGGYNLRGATAVDLGTFEPEDVTAFEIGAKLDLLDDRLRVDLAMFQSRFEDIQLLQFELVEGQIQPMAFIENGGEARIEGGELELTALFDRLRLSGSFGIVDARYTQLDPNVVEVTLDSEFLNTPDATAALAADWSQPTGFGAVDWHIDYAWRDDVPFAYDRNSIARQEAYGLWNARVQVRFEKAGLDLGLWVRNLTDERYMSRALDSRIFVSASLGDPRTYGLSLGWRFGRE
jgi:iron complex outermembrane receptor protein